MCLQDKVLMYKNDDLKKALERVLITDEIRKLGKTIEMVVTMSEEQYQDARSFLGEITQHKEKGNPVLLVGEVMKLILDHEEKIKFLEGFPAAAIILQSMREPSETQLRVAFDLDAVLFSDDSERDLDALLEHEIQNRDIPLSEGPLKPFAGAFGRIQRKSDRSMKESCPIRTYIITSRDALVGQRALLTLRSWGLEIDKCFFLAGAPNDEVLKAVNPHIFFDDQFSHIHRAREKGTPSGDVTHGVTREDDEKKRGTDFKKTINVAVSSKALFNLEEEHGVFEEEGLEKYIELQLEREDQILDPGAAFPFIKALQNVNAKLKERDPKEKEIFTITLMSHDNAQVGIRLQKSIEHHGLIISRMALTCGDSAVEYLKAFNITLFLTSHENEVTDAISKGFPSAVMSLQPMNTPSETQLRIAFGLDAVLFSDDSERIYQAEGLTAFLEHEIKNKDIPLKEGPLKPFAEAIGRMKKKFRSAKKDCPIRTYIVTSRSSEVGQRALLTLRSWGLEIDVSHFLAGSPKDEVLKTINPHIFFDDQFPHVHRAREKGTPSGHVTRQYDTKKRGTDFKKTINIAVSSRALFNLEEEHRVFDEEGLEEYIKLHLEREDQPLEHGAAFPFIKALKNVNAKLKELKSTKETEETEETKETEETEETEKTEETEEEIFAITLMSHNNAQVGIRLQESIDYHGLSISRMALTCGESVVDYLKAYNIALFLTSYEDEVKDAISKGFPAAVMSLQPMNTPSEIELRIAFDFDAVFSDESERIYQDQGLKPYMEHEIEKKDIPLKEGPLKPFAEAIGRMQKKFRSAKKDCPIRTYSVTSRDTEVEQRALLTLRSWGLKIDVCHFLAGLPKDEVLKMINPHIFFDDQISHIDKARKKGTPSGHVPSVTPEYDEQKRESSKKKLEF